MPIRTASLNRQIQKNGARLHQAMASRALSQRPDQPASEHEQALLNERRSLKEANAARQADAKLRKPRPQPTWLVAKAAQAAKPPKAPKAPKAAKKEPKEAKAAAKGNKPSRADKVAKKAEALEAAKRATKKSAKT